MKLQESSLIGKNAILSEIIQNYDIFLDRRSSLTYNANSLSVLGVAWLLCRRLTVADQNKAPAFALDFRVILQKSGLTQKVIAAETGINSTAVNRLCRHGIGREHHISDILGFLGLQRKEIEKILKERRAEISEGSAREIWQGSEQAFVNVEDYLRDTCPIPLERAYCSTYHGIPIGRIVALAKDAGIPDLDNLRVVDPWKFKEFFDALEGEFGKKKAEDLMARKPGRNKFPPVILLDLEQEERAEEYVELTRCSGRLIFDLPHLVLGRYTFEKDGRIGKHRNSGGIEFLYSQEGMYELTYAGTPYPVELKPGASILMFDARKNHEIALVQGDGGCLLMARFYPAKRRLKPGPKLKDRKKTRSGDISN